jgi:diguanylate cyclase (GGDEF)-like protein
MLIHVLKQKELAPFLRRHMANSKRKREVPLSTFLKEVLAKSNEFVPSESGSIFLDDPVAKFNETDEAGSLTAVACFGKAAKSFVGQRVKMGQGIVGWCYEHGSAYLSKQVKKDRLFAANFDKNTGHKSHSIICVPITIKGNTIGVLELINRKDKQQYDDKDLFLLKVFANYISSSIQNFLDSKRNAELSKMDNLTGLSNDRNFHAVLQTEVSRSWKTKRELGLIFLDLDHFKEVNDHHGHLAGSHVLTEVGELLRQAVTNPRADIARYGGDEYVVVLPGSGVRESAETAERIRMTIEKFTFLNHAYSEVPALNLSGQITASIGVACLHAHVKTGDPGLLIRASDEAMYASKKSGKNCVTVSKALSRKRRKSPA